MTTDKDPNELVTVELTRQEATIMVGLVVDLLAPGKMGLQATLQLSILLANLGSKGLVELGQKFTTAVDALDQ